MVVSLQTPSAGSEPSQDFTHATSTAGRDDQQHPPQPDATPGRFVVVVSDGDNLELWFFDKTKQSDVMHRRTLEVTPGTITKLGSSILIWQLEGEAI